MVIGFVHTHPTHQPSGTVDFSDEDFAAFYGMMNNRYSWMNSKPWDNKFFMGVRTPESNQILLAKN